MVARVKPVEKVKALSFAFHVAALAILASAKVPVHPKVKFWAVILPVILVSLVIACTTFEFNLPAAKVPAQVKVCVVPAETIVMLVSSTKVCVAPVRVFREVIPLLPLTVDQEYTPAPFVVKTCPFVPSDNVLKTLNPLPLSAIQAILLLEIFGEVQIISFSRLIDVSTPVFSAYNRA